MGRVLEEVAATADEVADEQREVAEQAREMQRRRDDGWSWAKVLDEDDGARLVRAVRMSARRLAEASAKLATAIVRGLSEEGESRRRIAQRLGVTHQRISAMLHRDRGGPGHPDATPTG